eukprot:gene9686-11887_t
MDPLDPEFIYKSLTKGAPIEVEKVLNVDLKETLKSPYVWGSFAVGLLAPSSSNYHHHQNNGGGGEIIQRTTTTTTTTTIEQPIIPSPPLSTYYPPSSSSSSSTTTTTTSSNNSNRLPLEPPQQLSSPTPKPLVNKSGEPLPIDEQNRILQKDNKTLRKDLENMNHWVQNQMKSFDDRLHRLEKHNRDLEVELEREKLCHICEENEKQVCWTKCGHRLCARCAVVIKNHLEPRCSICRRKVQDYIECWNT